MTNINNYIPEKGVELFENCKSDVVFSLGKNHKHLEKTDIFKKVFIAYYELLYGNEEGIKLPKEEYLEILQEWEHEKSLYPSDIPRQEEDFGMKLKRLYTRDRAKMDLTI